MRCHILRDALCFICAIEPEEVIMLSAVNCVNVLYTHWSINGRARLSSFLLTSNAIRVVRLPNWQMSASA